MSLKKLREGWRKAKEKRRQIDEAIDKQLTPELKLLQLENGRKPMINLFITILGGILVIMIILVTVAGIGGISLTLKNYYGENQWKEMREGNYVYDEMAPLFWGLGGFIIFFVVIFGYNGWRYDKKEAQLKREILARLKAEGKK